MKQLYQTLVTAVSALTLSTLASAGDFTVRVECTVRSIDGAGAATAPFSTAQIGDPLVVEYVLDFPGQPDSAVLFVNGIPIPGINYQIDYATSKATFLGQALPLTDTVPAPYEDGFILASGVNAALGYTGVANGVFYLSVIDFIQPPGAVIPSNDLAVLSGSMIDTTAMFNKIIAYNEAFPSSDGVVFGVDRVSVAAFNTPTTSFCDSSLVGACASCGNVGAPGNGCANSTFPAGGNLAASGVAGASLATDTLVLTATNIAGPALFFQANGIAGPAPFGDGMLCAAGGIIRLGVVSPVAGSASYPGGATPAPIHVAGGPIVSGDTKHYQCWYRDAAAFCTPSTFNTTQGVSLTWGP